MRAVLLVLLVVGATLVIAEPVSACPDPDNPCDPPPMSLCTGPVKITADPVRWAYCTVTGL